MLKSPESRLIKAYRPKNDKKTIPFSAQNHTFLSAKPYLSQRRAFCNLLSDKRLNYAKNLKDF